MRRREEEEGTGGGEIGRDHGGRGQMVIEICVWEGDMSLLANTDGKDVPNALDPNDLDAPLSFVAVSKCGSLWEGREVGRSWSLPIAVVEISAGRAGPVKSVVPSRRRRIAPWRPTWTSSGGHTPDGAPSPAPAAVPAAPALTATVTCTVRPPVAIRAA